MVNHERWGLSTTAQTGKSVFEEYVEIENLGAHRPQDKPLVKKLTGVVVKVSLLEKMFCFCFPCVLFEGDYDGRALVVMIMAIEATVLLNSCGLLVTHPLTDLGCWLHISSNV